MKAFRTVAPNVGHSELLADATTAEACVCETRVAGGIQQKRTSVASPSATRADVSVAVALILGEEDRRHAVVRLPHSFEADTSDVVRIDGEPGHATCLIALESHVE